MFYATIRTKYMGPRIIQIGNVWISNLPWNPFSVTHVITATQTPTRIVGIPEVRKKNLFFIFRPNIFVIFWWFLVRWSLSGLLFLLFSLIMYHHVSSCISLFSNYCNFMWFIKLRASAGMCVVFAGVRWCVWVCAGVHRCA